MPNINIKVDRVMNAVPTVNQNHMSAEDDVTIAARRPAHAANHVIRRGASPSPHFGVKHVARLDQTLVIVIPLIGLSEILLMLSVIRTRVSALFLVELAVALLVLTVVVFSFSFSLISVVFCHSRDAHKSKQCRRTSCYPQSSLHIMPPIKFGLPFGVPGGCKRTPQRIPVA